jgi:signal transduction histidine kinase
MMGTVGQPVWHRGCAAALVAAAVGLALTCGITSSRWIDAPFPGFFVMANRVVASVSLPHWSIALHRHDIYQKVVVTVDGQPVATSTELYARVRRLPPGSSVTYTLEKDGRTAQVTLSSLTFTVEDYFFLFAAYLFNGLAFAFIGISVWFLKPDTAASRALFIGGVTSGLFTLTAADLYSPHWFFRLHVLGEAFFPAGFTHLALVFPVDRFRRYRSFFLSVPYIAAFTLAGAYEVFLYEPSAYSLIHNLCMVYVGISAVIFLGAVIWDYCTPAHPLVRRRIRVIFLGLLSGFTVPAMLMFSSGITGGKVAVNYAAFTAFFFPLSVGYAIVKHDLFEIDALLKRGAYYLALTATVTLAFLSFLTVLDFTLHQAELAYSPLFQLLFTLAVVLFLNPLKDSVQRAVDRVFFRLRYNPQKVLEVTSASLADTLYLEEILTLVWRTVSEALGVTQGGIFLLTADKTQYVAAYPRGGTAPHFSAVHPLVQEVRRQGRILSLYDLSERALPPTAQEERLQGMARLSAQLIVPLILKGDLRGFLALGGKASGAFFSVDDRDFLYTLANQSALSISNALSYKAIEELNASLEQKVEERTQELARTNTELQVSLTQLEQTYRNLQRSQENLSRAEKMAALGRLTAGVAHEMNTPLGASLTSLKLLQELVDEYQTSINDPGVNQSDHQDIAAEMDQLVRATRQWLEKAAAHIRSLKLHTRDLQQGEKRPFSVLHVIEDTGLLLSHRLRLSRCSLVVSCTAPDPLLYGDPSKLGQVLTNLVANAIDAYKDVGNRGAEEIRVEVNEEKAFLEIRVSDRGCGIPPENMERIFEEFFSTKPLGEGTGLGLPLARDLLTNYFGGTISVESLLGHGSVFVLRLPRDNTRNEERPLSVGQSSPPLERQLGPPHEPVDSAAFSGPT